MIDFLVIGGGIAGVSAAARLSHLGVVTVLERETGLGYHASGRSAALFEETYGKPSVVALNRASHAYHATANGGVLSPRGLMLLGSAETAEAFAADLLSMEMEEMPLADAVARVPILQTEVIDRIGYHEATWDIDTDRLIQNFAAEVRKNRGTVQTKAEVTAITRTATGWQVSITSNLA